MTIVLYCWHVVNGGRLSGMDWKKEEMRWAAKTGEILLTLTEKTATIPVENFEQLDDYSCTIPSGTVVGKFWRRHQPYSGRGAWWLGQYVDDPDPEKIGIVWRELFVAIDWGAGRVESFRATDDQLDAYRAAKAMAS